MPQFLFQFIRLITKSMPNQTQITKFILSLRYHHRQIYPNVFITVARIQLSPIIQFSVIMLKCNNLNYQKQINFHTIQLILKRIVLQADFFFLLLIYCKWAHSKTPYEVDKALGPSYRQMIRPLTRSNQTKPINNEQVIKMFDLQLQILEYLNNKNFFFFFFQLMNARNEQGQNNIDFYFLQLQEMEQQRPISSSQLQIIKNNIYVQYGKLRKRKYQEETIHYLYKWLQSQLQLMFYQAENSYHHSIEIFNQIIRSHNNFCGATLLQLIDTSIENITPTKMKYILEVIDTCIIEGTYKISTQAILFLVCTIFNKIHLKKLNIKFQVIIQHLLLWRLVSIKRKLPHKLLTCFVQWVPLLFGLSSPILPKEPELLQLYRQHLLKLQSEEEMSLISGLILVVQQLQIRKIQAVYQQLQQFHQLMENSKLFIKQSKSLKSEKIVYSYKVSKINKSASDINSLLNNLQSKISILQPYSKNFQLQILSKSNSMSGYGSMNADSSNKELGEFVQIIMSLIDLFDYHVAKSASITLQQSNLTISQQESLNLHHSRHSNGLPIVSQLEVFQRQNKGQSLKLSQIAEQPIKNIKINYIAKDQDCKKKMAKNRGLIVKTQIYQIGYLLQGKNSKISLFITFFKPVKQFSLQLQQKSFKVRQSKLTKLSEPRIDKQYSLNLTVKSMKVYELQGVKHSQRLIKSKIRINIEYNKTCLQQQYDIPISIFNLMQFQPIQKENLQVFEGQALLETQWFRACPKLLKHGPNYLKRFILFELDAKGNYLMKIQLLQQIMFVRVIMVQSDMKIQIMNSKNVLVGMGLMQVMG